MVSVIEPESNGSGTWIRTKINGSKFRCPVSERSEENSEQSERPIRRFRRFGSGTWIRTKINGSKFRCPTVRLSRKAKWQNTFPTNAKGATAVPEQSSVHGKPCGAYLIIT